MAVALPQRPTNPSSKGHPQITQITHHTVKAVLCALNFELCLDCPLLIDNVRELQTPEQS